jgi:hypothetical protein
VPWQQLLNIYREAGEIIAAEQAAPPQACPNDGEPLRLGPDGELFCPFDGWPRESD